MRYLALALLAACGPKVMMDPPIEQDDPAAGAPTQPQPSPEVRRPAPVAPAGPGARSTTVSRARLQAVIDAGPGTFLHGFEVAPVMEGEKFAGWRLVRVMDGEHRFDGLDLAPGDVLIDVNGLPVSKPDQLAALFDQLRTANEIDVDLVRNQASFRITIAVTP